jgi:glycosyltransferase involved in cell wall biosynthesis
MANREKSLIEAFNQADSILVISSYPEKGIKYSDKVCAVGGFTKNTIDGLNSYFARNKRQRKMVVLTVIVDKEEIYKEDGVLVCRIFKRNNPFSYLKLWQAIFRFNQVKDVLVEFEFASFGDIKTTALFPFTLFGLRLARKNITLVLHQVVSDLKNLIGHLGWRKTGLKIKLFNFSLKAFFWTLVFPSQKVVVLEETLKKRLARIVGMREKMVVIPHGVDQNLNIISKEKARIKLGLKKDEPILLYFGYLTWYKGVDFLIKTFTKNEIKIKGNQVRLIIAGGESPTQKIKPHYQNFVKKVYALARKSGKITITGFVEEKKLPLYFAAADLIVLPYRIFMSSSGPLSLCLGFSKPFIMSQALSGYFSSQDFAVSFSESGLKKRDILFPLQSQALARKIESAFKNKLKLANFSINLAKKRDFSVLAQSYIKAMEDVSLRTAFIPMGQALSGHV